MSSSCSHSTRPKVVNCSVKLRGGANTTMKVKSLDTDNMTAMTVLSLLRPLDVFKRFSNHVKCALVNQNTKDHLCKFCLLRSCLLKCRQQKGRNKIKPSEYEAAFEDLNSETYIEDLESVIQQVNSIIPSFQEHFCISWNCKECNNEDLAIDLSCSESNQEISLLVSSYEQQVFREHGDHDGSILK